MSLKKALADDAAFANNVGITDGSKPDNDIENNGEFAGLKVLKGKIIKGVGGLYTVKAADLDCIEAEKRIDCTARGVFRFEGKTPLAGDNVLVHVSGEGRGVIDEILERKNSLSRPPVANIDQLVIVSSVKKPRPNLQVLDKMILIALANDINPIILFNKADLDELLAEELGDLYTKAGFPVMITSAVNDKGTDQLKAVLPGKVTAFAGNSGVGKSSLLNSIYPDFELETAGISDKLGRGKHTTRTTELFEVKLKDESGFVFDTPGFSSLDVAAALGASQEDEEGGSFEKSEVQHLFPEFVKAFEDFGSCRFANCSHLNEKDCAVKKALDEGGISPSRFESYKQICDEIANSKAW